MLSTDYRDLLMINTRALLFLANYILGTKKSIKLTETEKRVSRLAVAENLYQINTRNPIDLSLQRISDTTVLSYVEQRVAFGANGEIDAEKCTLLYLKSKFAGIYGDFDFHVDSINCKAHCIDTWDFNALNFALTLRLPPVLCFALKRLSSWLGGIESTVWLEYKNPWSDAFDAVDDTDYDLLNDSVNRKGLSWSDYCKIPTHLVSEVYSTWVVDESELVKLNENHAFTQTWDVDLTGLCSPVDRNLKYSAEEMAEYTNDVIQLEGFYFHGK